MACVASGSRPCAPGRIIRFGARPCHFKSICVLSFSSRSVRAGASNIIEKVQRKLRIRPQRLLGSTADVEWLF